MTSRNQEPSTRPLTKFSASADGLGTLLPDQLNLLTEALRELEVARDKETSVKNQILAKADFDGAGLPWKAYIYSADAAGFDLRLVGHTENEQHLLIKQRRLPAGKKITIPGKEAPQGFVCLTETLLESRVFEAVSQGDVSAEFVSELLRLFENAICPQSLVPFSLGELVSLLPSHPSASLPTVKIIQGVDAFHFGRGQPNFVDNSLFLVASQFNFLESTNTDHMPLSCYGRDRTQGPRASLGCPGMLVQRNASFKHSGGLDLQPFFRPLRGAYVRGYFMPRRIPIGEESAALRHVSENWRELRALAQRGKTLFGSETTQVFMAAPSFQGDGIPLITDHDSIGRMCEIIVSRQYQALGALAMLRAAESGTRVNLHITLIGQGAFRNPPQVMETAFALLLEAIGGADVIVHVHAWSADDVDAALAALSKSLSLKELNAIRIIPSDDFYR